MNIFEIVNLNDCFEVVSYFKNKLRYLQGRNITDTEVSLIRQELEDNIEQILECALSNDSIRRLYIQIKKLIT